MTNPVKISQVANGKFSEATIAQHGDNQSTRQGVDKAGKEVQRAEGIIAMAALVKANAPEGVVAAGKEFTGSGNNHRDVSKVANNDIALS